MSLFKKNYIKVDRKGTEASSITKAMNHQWGIEVGEPEVKVVKLDRPFIFVIYDSSIEQVLFIGNVNNV